MPQHENYGGNANTGRVYSGRTGTLFDTYKEGFQNSSTSQHTARLSLGLLSAAAALTASTHRKVRVRKHMRTQEAGMLAVAEVCSTRRVEADSAARAAEADSAARIAEAKAAAKVAEFDSAARIAEAKAVADIAKAQVRMMEIQAGGPKKDENAASSDASSVTFEDVTGADSKALAPYGASKSITASHNRNCCTTFLQFSLNLVGGILSLVIGPASTQAPKPKSP